MPNDVNDGLDQPVDDGLGDLLSDAQLSEQDESPEGGESDAQSPETDGAAESDDAKPADEQQEEKPEPKGKDKKSKAKSEDADDDGGEEEVSFTYRGKKYSIDDLKSDPDLRNKVLTGANQQSHYQELYGQTKTEMQKLEDRLKKFEESQAQAAAEAQRRAAQEAGPKLTPEKLNAAYTENVKKMVEDGWLEPDLQELYPNAVSGVMSMRDELFTRINQVEAVLGGLINHTEADIQTRQQYTEKQRHEGMWGKINQIFDHISSEGGIFAPLAQQETRNQFLTELEQSLNPEVEHLISDPRILRNLWIGANHDQLIAEAAAKKAESDAKRNQQLRNAAGEGSGTRRTVTQDKRLAPGEAEGWADL